MRARIDAVRHEVEAGGRRFRFRLELRDDHAVVEVDEREYRVRPLRWREKVTLARFAGLPAEELEEQFVRLASGCTGELPELDRSVLAALAEWMNEPADGEGVPLESRSLAAVTVQLCRATQLRPSDFDNMAAVEVEAMWLALGTGVDIETAPHEPFASQRVPPAEALSHSTKIVIVPDPVDDVVATGSHVEPSDSSAPAQTDDPAQVTMLAESAAPAMTPFAPPLAAVRTLETPLETTASPRRPLRFRVTYPGATTDTRTEPSVASSKQPEVMPLDNPPSREPARAGEWRAAVTPVARPEVEDAPRVDVSRIDIVSPPHSDASRQPLFAEHRAAFAQPDIDGTSALVRAPFLMPLQSELRADAFDSNALFEELADRLEQAAADMGIVES